MLMSNRFWMFVSTITAVFVLAFMAFSINHHNQQIEAGCKRYPIGCEVPREK